MEGGRREEGGALKRSAEQQPRHSKSSHTMCGGMAAGTEESVHICNNTAAVSQAQHKMCCVELCVTPTCCATPGNQESPNYETRRN